MTSQHSARRCTPSRCLARRFALWGHPAVDLQPEPLPTDFTSTCAAGVCNAECALVHKPLGCIGCSKRYHPPLNNTTHGASAHTIVLASCSARWPDAGSQWARTHTTPCNQAHVPPRLRAVYIENQKAGSRSIISALRMLSMARPTPNRLHFGYEHEGYEMPHDGLPSEAANFTVFTRRPLDTFISGFSETMGRVVTMKSKDDWAAAARPPICPANEHGSVLHHVRWRCSAEAARPADVSPSSRRLSKRRLPRGPGTGRLD